MNQTVNADPQLIFHTRLITVRERCEDVLSLFWYGLSIYLAALYESSSFPLQPNNPVSHRCVGEQVSFVTVSYSTFHSDMFQQDRAYSLIYLILTLFCSLVNVWVLTFIANLLLLCGRP